MVVLAGRGSVSTVSPAATRSTAPARELPPVPRPRRASVGRARPVGLGAVPMPARPAAVACERVFVRRRVVALLAVGVVVAAAVLALGVLRAGAADDGVPERTAVVQVHGGETLWELARRVAPQGRTPAVVERIRQLNGLQGNTIHPGQPLVVPDGR